MKIEAPTDNTWPEYCWEEPVPSPPVAERPFWALNKEERQIEYSMAANGYKRPVPCPRLETIRYIDLDVITQISNGRYGIDVVFIVVLRANSHTQAHCNRIADRERMTITFPSETDIKRLRGEFLDRAIRRGR